MKSDTDLEKLIEKLPVFIKQYIRQHPNKEKIIEIYHKMKDFNISCCLRALLFPDRCYQPRTNGIHNLT